MEYSSLQLASPLWELTCHMGLHSVNYNLAGDIPALPSAEEGTGFSDPGERCKAVLT